MGMRYTWIYGEQEQYFMDFLPQEIAAEYKTSPQLLVYGMIQDDVAVGAAAVHVLEEEAVLAYLYVAPEYRRRGIGRECLTQLSFDLWDVGVESLLAYYIPKEQEVLHRWMEALDAEFSPSGGGAFRFTIGDAKGCSGLSGSTQGAQPLSACSQAELQRLSGRLKKSGANLVALPVEKDDYEASYSCVYREGGEIRAVLLVNQTEEGLDLPLLYSDVGKPAVSLLLMRYALAQAGRALPDETVCTLRTVDGTMTKLLEKLLARPATQEIRAKLGFDDYDDYHRQFYELLLAEPLPKRDAS